MSAGRAYVGTAQPLYRIRTPRRHRTRFGAREIRGRGVGASSTEGQGVSAKPQAEAVEAARMILMAEEAYRQG